MKRVHLICNAHLDPVWLWRWQEGCTEALSTFRTAEPMQCYFLTLSNTTQELTNIQEVKATILSALKNMSTLLNFLV